jgi:hypothetical protein
MALSDDDIAWLASEALLTDEQAKAIRAALRQRRAAAKPSAPAWQARFDLLHVAYYIGAMLVIGAMAFFVNIGWETLGGWGLVAIALAYATTFVLVGRRLWAQHDLLIPGGLMITMAVAMMPLATYGVERALGLWPGVDPGSYRGFHEWVRSGWLGMEVVTISAAAVALRWFQFPFLTLPLAFCLWYVTMDAAPLIAGTDSVWHVREWVSLGFGLATVAIGGMLELKWHRDFGYWLYRFGLMAFWGGLLGVAFSAEYNTSLGTVLRLLAGLLGIATVTFGATQRRPVFILSGTVAVLTYAGHLVIRDDALHHWATLAFGLLIAGTSFAIGQGKQAKAAKPERDLGYGLAAALILWAAAGLTFMQEPEWRKALFVPICLFSVFVSVALQQRAFIVLGALGLLAYVGRLATEIFQDSLLFPFVLSGIGLAIIALAITYRKQHTLWRQALLERLPLWLVERLPEAEGSRLPMA